MKLPPWVYRLQKLTQIIIDDITQTNLMLHASSMAYITLGSIVPSLAVTLAVISAFQPLADPESTWFMDFKGFLLENLTPRAGEDMIALLENFLVNLDVARIGVIWFVFLFLILVLLLRNVEIALNSVWQVSNERSSFMRFIYFWLVITVLYRLSDDTVAWLSSRKISLTLNIQALVNNIYESLRKDHGSLSVNDLLAISQTNEIKPAEQGGGSARLSDS